MHSLPHCATQFHRTITTPAIFSKIAFILLFLFSLPPLLHAEVIDLDTQDGVRIQGDYHPGKKGEPAIVFIHMEKGSRTDWGRLPEKLSRRGFHTLALDLRGHGASTEKVKDAGAVGEDYTPAAADIKAAISWLRTKTTANPARIALVGAGVGANLALYVAAQDKRIENLALLSPGLTILGVSAESAIEAYGARPVLTFVSREDAYSARSALVLDALSRGQKYMQIYTGAGHGTAMLSREPGLETTLLSWLNGTLDATPMDITQAPPIRTRNAP